MADPRQLALFAAHESMPPPWILDLRGQAWLDDSGSLEGQLYVCRYFADGTSDTPFTADLVPGSARRAVLGGLRHFAGHLAQLTGWPDLQCRRTERLSTGQS
jgi:hypothetical protein